MEVYMGNDVFTLSDTQLESVNGGGQFANVVLVLGTGATFGPIGLAIAAGLVAGYYINRK